MADVNADNFYHDDDQTNSLQAFLQNKLRNNNNFYDPGRMAAPAASEDYLSDTESSNEGSFHSFPTVYSSMSNDPSVDFLEMDAESQETGQSGQSTKVRVGKKMQPQKKNSTTWIMKVESDHSVDSDASTVSKKRASDNSMELNTKPTKK
ncbi:OLC1v1004027C1 [Oldenlandia corymbosa var. corymbosa]|uniref:OLC1v1004027C1 n=1 Tax=Oldenlandia corymbosa var. corymbosa TaxID=529605 RepID=A0AAV1DDR4_OLDCO|nr:OLC1v1004027C1 [Oldenlandia corymbosa var. corymbosa]